MDITVLIPAYNEEKNIIACLDSILASPYPRENFEVIVIDDGSRDNTPSVVREYSVNHPNVSCISKENAGRSSALNKGISQARGRYILVTDADTVVGYDWIRMMSEALDNADMVQGSCYAKDVNHFMQKIQHARDLLRLKYYRSEAVIGVGANNGFRKEAALAIGGFNEETVHVTTDFIYRLKNKGYSISYYPEIVSHTVYPLSLSKVIKQRLRWNEFSKKDAADWRSPLFILQIAYSMGLSMLVLSGLLLSLITQKFIWLLIFPFAIFIDVMVFSKALVSMYRSEDRKWMPYFFLYSLFNTITIRVLLVPYHLYLLVKPRKKPTFNK